jgi:hypothetical protein
MINSLKLIVFVLLLQVGCKSGSSSSAETKTQDLANVSVISLDAITRGKKEQVQVSSSELTCTSNGMNKSNMVKEHVMLNEKQWEKIREEIAKIDLKGMRQLEAPSTNYMFDGDMATTLSITIEKQTYTSSTFDKQNPPEELKYLVNYVYGLMEE